MWRGAGLPGVAGRASGWPSYESGVHPTLAGVAIAMLVPAYAPRREEVDEAGRLTRAFRQSPNCPSSRARRLHRGPAVSGNERLLRCWCSPWTTWFVVPVFALANAGVRLDGETLRDALALPVTLGIVAALVGRQAPRRRRAARGCPVRCT